MALAPTDRNCIPALHGPTDTGHSWIANILAAAAVAAAAYNSAKAVEIADKEWKMANKYWQISQNWLDHYRNNYAPVEDQEINEATVLETEVPKYSVARGRARVVAWMGFRHVFHSAVRGTSRYCTGLRQEMLADISAAQADALALADGLGWRNERAYIETRDDVRFEKQFNTIKRGRNMVAGNVSFVKAAAGIYGDLYDQAWTGIIGAGQYLGYWSSRSDTQYPTTFLSGAPISGGYTGPASTVAMDADTGKSTLPGAASWSSRWVDIDMEKFTVTAKQPRLGESNMSRSLGDIFSKRLGELTSEVAGQPDILAPVRPGEFWSDIAQQKARMK